jgi:hypothetical protein
MNTVTSPTGIFPQLPAPRAGVISVDVAIEFCVSISERFLPQPGGSGAIDLSVIQFVRHTLERWDGS